MNEMERRLKRFKLKSPPEDLEQKVRAQKPEMPARSDGHWWQRRIAVPLPVLGLLVVLLIALSGFSVYQAAKATSPRAKADDPPGLPTATSSTKEPEADPESDNEGTKPIYHAVAYYVPGHGVVYSKEEIHQ